MKIKYLWLPAIILGIIGAAAKLGDTLLNVNGDGFFLNSDTCNIVFIAVILLTVIIGGFINFSDKTEKIKSSVRKDSLCGIFGFIASVALIGSGVMLLLSAGSTSSFVSSFIMCIFDLFGGAVLLYESCIAFTGHNSMKNVPLLTLGLPVWCCGRFIGLFMEYSKVSIRATEMFDIISVAFLMMFLFYQSMFFAEISDTLAIKRSSLYGIVFVVCGLITTTDIIIKMIYPANVIAGTDALIIEPTVSRILSIITDISLCGYAVFFIRDINKSVVKVPIEEKVKETKNEDVNKNIDKEYSEKIAKIDIEENSKEFSEEIIEKPETIENQEEKIEVIEDSKIDISEIKEPKIEEITQEEIPQPDETEDEMTVIPIIIEKEEEMPAVEENIEIVAEEKDTVVSKKAERAEPKIKKNEKISFDNTSKQNVDEEYDEILKMLDELSDNDDD